MGLLDDIHSIIAASSGMTGSPTGVTLTDGRVIQAVPGIATVNDGFLGTDRAINGDEKTLRFLSSDVPSLKSGDSLTWNGKGWKVKHVQFAGSGFMVKAFLQEVL